MPSSHALLPSWSHQRKKISTPTVQLLISSTLGSLNRISPNSTRCTEMTGDYSVEIKIAIFQSVWKRQRDEWRSLSNCRQIAAKIACFTWNISYNNTKNLREVSWPVTSVKNVFHPIVVSSDSVCWSRMASVKLWFHPDLLRRGWVVVGVTWTPNLVHHSNQADSVEHRNTSLTSMLKFILREDCWK